MTQPKKPRIIQPPIPATEDVEGSLDFDAERTRLRNLTNVELRKHGTACGKIANIDRGGWCDWNRYELAKEEFRRRQNERRIKTKVLEQR